MLRYGKHRYTIKCYFANLYYGERFTNDHEPDHIHLKGPKTNIKIGRNGKPLKGEKPLSPQQRRAIKQLWEEILKLFELF